MRCVLGEDEGRVVGRTDEVPSNGNDHDDDGDFDSDNDGVNRGRLGDALDEQQRHDEQDDQRGRVDDAVDSRGTGLQRRVTPGPRNQVRENIVEVFRPIDGKRSSAQAVFENERPADDPGNQLAHGDVGIGVGAASDGNHRGEFRIAQAREGAADGGDHERQNYAGAGILRGGRGGASEESGADDGSDAQSDEARPAESALEAALFFELRKEGGERFRAE